MILNIARRIFNIEESNRGIKVEINDLKIPKSDITLSKKVKIFDTTLRDGEQAPGIALTTDEKIQIAQKLDNLGINTIEYGFPAVSEGERKSAKLINDLGLNANICGLARVLKNDIDALLDCDLSYMHTFIGTSPLHRDFKLKMSKEEIVDKASSAIEYAKDHGITVEFSAEDSTRTELDYLIDVYKAVEGEGVVGIQPVIAPGAFYQYISGCNLRSEIGKMNGTYLLENVNNKKSFEVIIPSFELHVPFKLN